MASASVLQKLTQRAKQAEEIIAQLKAQIETVKQAAALSASRPEEVKLKAENESLRAEVGRLKTQLIYCEIKNGVKQVQIPIKKCKQEAAVEAGTPSNQGPASASQATAQVAKMEKPKQQQQKGGEKAKETKGDQPKKGKGGGGKGGEKKDASAAPEKVDIGRLDMRVGKIVAVEKHPDADSLYVEQVDLGEGQPRTIVSGLVKHVPIEQMQDRLAVFMCNLKPAKMRGVMSQGMIMCANSPEKVEILVPPPGSQAGDRVFADDYTGEPDALLNPKKKIWETIKPDLLTNGDKVAAYKGSVLTIKGKGPVVAPSLPNTQIS